MENMIFSVQTADFRNFFPGGKQNRQRKSERTEPAGRTGEQAVAGCGEGSHGGDKE